MRVVMIGSGNTATVLGKIIQRSENEVVQVFGRNAAHAHELAAILDCTSTTEIPALASDADIYIVAIADKALYELGSWLNLGRKLVVHTAGSASMELLKSVSTNYGVLYPLQSLRKEMEQIPDVPLLINANTSGSLSLIEDFAHSISSLVYKTGERKRELMHVAAVVVSNFTNHLYTLAADYCKQQDLEFATLIPLINQVANRLADASPQQMQTGPAMRNDVVTIQKHIGQLQSFPQLQHIYKMFTEEIVEYYKPTAGSAPL